MTAAQLQTLNPVSADELLRARYVRARFEALAEWGIPLADARAIADSRQRGHRRGGGAAALRLPSRPRASDSRIAARDEATG